VLVASAVLVAIIVGVPRTEHRWETRRYEEEYFPIFAPKSRLVDAASVGGIRIGEPLDDALSRAGQPHLPRDDLPSATSPVVELDSALIGFAHDRVDFVVARLAKSLPSPRDDYPYLRSKLAGMRLATAAGDEAGARLAAVRPRYPHAVAVKPCVGQTLLVERSAAPGDVFALSFAGGRLEAAGVGPWARVAGYLLFRPCWTGVVTEDGVPLDRPALPPSPVRPGA
jgi:hypothetical protein